MSAQPNPILYWCDFCEADHETLECPHPAYEEGSTIDYLQDRITDLENIESEIEALIDELESDDGELVIKEAVIDSLQEICMAF